LLAQQISSFCTIEKNDCNCKTTAVLRRMKAGQFIYKIKMNIQTLCEQGFGEICWHGNQAGFVTECKH